MEGRPIRNMFRISSVKTPRDEQIVQGILYVSQKVFTLLGVEVLEDLPVEGSQLSGAGRALEACVEHPPEAAHRIALGRAARRVPPLELPRQRVDRLPQGRGSVLAVPLQRSQRLDQLGLGRGVGTASAC